jgi:HPt (histidine-containing phosphotransfer) domain-containing protein
MSESQDKSGSDVPFNLKELVGLYGEETVSELLQMTLDESVGLLKDIAKGEANHDANLVMASAHQMKGLALTMTMTKLSAVSLELETAARQENWPVIPDARVRLEAEFERVSHHVKSVLSAQQRS